MFKTCDVITKGLRSGRIAKNFSTTVVNRRKRVAIVLSGCGVLDGAEVHEASATAVHLSKMGMEISFFAPNINQKEVVNHHKGCPSEETRNALVEAARIARGKISPLSDLDSSDKDAVVFPGGFGVAKTLTTFAEDGASFAVDQEVIRVLLDFQAAKKPMGFMCISAVLPAKIFCCTKVTLGKKGDPKLWPHSAAIDAAIEMGALVEEQEVNCFSFDTQNLVFSTPAFMYEGTFGEIFDGIGNMLKSMKKVIC